MGIIRWFSILACISCCILSKAEVNDEQMLSDDPAPSTEGSIHGFRPCLDDSCSALSLDSETDDLSWQVLSAVVRAHKDIYPVPDSVTHDHDILVQHCVPFHRSTVDQISSIELRHPDIQAVKMKIIEDFIRFVSDFALLNTTDCDSPMKLIGFMKLAVRSLEVEYSHHCGDQCNCVYTAGAVDYEPSSTTDYEPSSTIDYIPTSESVYHSSSASPHLDDEGYKTPCPEESGDDSYEETYAEDQHYSYGSSMLVGSIRGVPGVNFPNYTDIPLTSFSCADKKYIPGFYADLETDCQVFHVCYEHRRESFLCPLGTTFNQPILACDFWYSSNCSLAKDYYEVNVKSEEEVKEEAIEVVKEIIAEEEAKMTEDHSKATEEVYEEVHKQDEYSEVQEEVDIRQFLPVKAKVVDFEKPLKGIESVAADKQAVQDVQEVASQIFTNIVSTATDVVAKTRVAIDKVPEPEMKLEPSSLDLSNAQLKPILSAKKIPGVKIPAAKFAVKTAIPLAKFVTAKKVVPLVAKAAVVAAAVPAAKLAAFKTAIPVVAAKKIVPLAAKAAVAAAVPAAKVAAVKTAIPVAAKVAAVKTAIPVAAKVAAVPKVVKAKMLAVPAKKIVISGVKVAATVPKLTVPFLKAKKLAPVMKGKVLKAAAVPVLKAKILPMKGSLAGLAPIAKAKLVKAAAISPLTKKTLALGYMKLLKAKKLALMG